MDRSSKMYDHKLIVTPNFGSVDYMNDKVDLLNSKLNERDSAFFSAIGVKNSKDIKKIEVKPVIDIYNFITNSKNGNNYAQNPPNFELFKLFAEEKGIEKVVKDPVTSKNYPFHSLTITTEGTTSRAATIDPILQYLNDSDYFRKIQKETVANVHEKMVQNDSIISQINHFLNALNQRVGKGSSNEKLVYYNENTQLNDVIKTKDLLVYEQGSHRVELVNLDKIVKENSAAINCLNMHGLNGKMFLILPFLFIMGFLSVSFFQQIVRKHQAQATK
jgi:hypothetical protein